MGYPHYQITVGLLTSGGDQVLGMTTTGMKGRWDAGPATYFVRRVGIQHTTTGTRSAKPIFKFLKSCGGAATVTAAANVITALSTTSGGVRRDGVYFNDSFASTKIPAGYGIRVLVTTKATGGGTLFRAWALIEPSTERLQNLGTGAFVSVTG